MAVAAVVGGASANFNPLYDEVTRLSRNLSVPSPREFNDPGQTLQITATPLNGAAVDSNVPPQKFDLFIRQYYDKEKDQHKYMLYFKTPLGQEQQVSNGTSISAALAGVGFSTFFPTGATTTGVRYTINGQVLTLSGTETLDLDPLNGRIVYNATTGAAYNQANTNNIPIGLMKLDAVNGLDLGLTNDRISQQNLAIEALNKVLIVANNNLDKSIELRI